MLAASGLWELVEQRSELTPDARLLVDEGGEQLTFGELRNDAQRVAAGLAALGVAEGTVVSWQLPTWCSSFVLVAALARLGAVQNPILPIYRSREVGFVVGQAGTRLLVVPSLWRGFDYGAMASELAASTDGLLVLLADRVLPDGDAADLPPAPAPGGVRWLFYTSGTTADPKGARHTDATIRAAAAGMAVRLALEPHDRHGLVFPFTHIGGITWLFASLLVGSANIITEAFDPVATPQLLRREDVTLAGSGTPFHLAYLAAQRVTPGERLFPSVRAFPGGGAPKPPQLHHEVKSELGGVGVVSGYGLTEAPLLTMGSVEDTDETLADSEGFPMPGVELRVVGLDGRVVGPGEEGEVQAKAPQMMLGYVDASLDAEAFDDDDDDGGDEGWFRTGDLGRLEPGGLVITGRLKDVIIRKGENISAKEVEDLLYGHPEVADVAVVGVPDPALGERCCAVVVPRDAEQPPALASVVAFLEGTGLMRQKFPEQLELVDALPRNPSGKVVKTVLRERYGAA